MIFHPPAPQFAFFDAGGVLYHANYFYIFEQSRENFLNLSGVPYSQLAKIGTHFAIRETNVRYLSPIRYGDELEVVMNCKKLGKASFTLEYVLKVVNRSPAVVSAQGTTNHVAVTTTSEAFDIVPIPDDVYEALKGIS